MRVSFKLGVEILLGILLLVGGCGYLVGTGLPSLPSLPDMPSWGQDGTSSQRHDGKAARHQHGGAAHRDGGRTARCGDRGTAGQHAAGPARRCGTGTPEQHDSTAAGRHGGDAAGRYGVTAADLYADLAAVDVVDELPTTDDGVPAYDRDAQFGADFIGTPDGCDVRNEILVRDLRHDTLYPDGCLSGGVLDDPYTGRTIRFDRSADPMAVQIEHVFPLGLAWYSGAYEWSQEQRVAYANDPRVLIAVDGPANQSHSDSPPSEWMPPNDAYGCAWLDHILRVADLYDLEVTDEDAETTRQTAEEGCRG